ncbi:uncharacterized protein LOC115577644 [Sparus aurata]|uniref:uncharacterized protein LOC115577644 n=1 Tax=Sparus aurata TaxID=8175 RepID=UPI0011C18119|nr:uncharacterized protein LOC115577644 [Sparus aurata]
MRSRRSLFGILLLLVVLSVAYKDSDRPEGKNNHCPVSPDNPLMVQRPITTIKGKDGDTVILPCSTKDKMDISHDRVEWFKGPTTENKPIHKYVWRGRAIQTQRDDFKGRTSISEEGLLSGDCSLSLTVTTSDSGLYYGCVAGLLYCPVNLEVLAAAEDSSQMNRNDPESPVNSLIHPEENTNLYDPLNPDMLQCPNRTIEGKDGDTVILPCSTKNKMDISLEEVEWTFMDPTTGKKTVHLYFQGKDILHEQRDDFKDRTSLFKKELSSGNCSLSLLATTSHSGKYQSCVGGHLCCTVNLKVLPEGKEDTSQKHQNVTESPDNPLNGTDGQKNIIGGVVGGVLGVAALIIIITLAYRYREQLMNFCRRRSSNNPQTQSVSYQAQHPPQNQENEPADQNPNEEQIQMLGYEDQDDPADGNESKKLE